MNEIPTYLSLRKPIYLLCDCSNDHRIFVPDSPFLDNGRLSKSLKLIAEQLKGLSDVDGTAYQGCFYILEVISYLKIFDLCVDLPDQKDICTEFFRILFSVLNDRQREQVQVASFFESFCCYLSITLSTS